LIDCILDIRPLLVFQVLNIPSKYAKFGNMGPFRTLYKYNTKHFYGPLITPKDDHFAKIALKLNKK